MNINRKWLLIVLIVGVLIGGTSTRYVLNKYYERQLIDNMLMGNSINIMGDINVLNSLRLKNNDQAIYLLENDLDTNLVTIEMFEENITESVLGNVKQSIKAASDYRGKYPYSTDNEEWNGKVSKILGKYK
jgi:hypothetical protein